MGIRIFFKSKIFRYGLLTDILSSKYFNNTVSHDDWRKKSKAAKIPLIKLFKFTLLIVRILAFLVGSESKVGSVTFLVGYGSVLLSWIR